MDNVCSHLRGLCSYFEQRSLKRFVGKLNSISDTATFVNACKELARIMTKCESDDFEAIFKTDRNPHWNFEEYPKGLTCTTFQGTKVKIFYRFKERFLNDILTMDPSNPDTHKIRAGLMKLHTSREGDEPTRSERDEIYSSISHRSSLQILASQRELDQFNLELVTRDVLNHLVKKGGKPRRLYLPLFAVPPSTKSSYYLMDHGGGKPLQRHLLESFITKGILRVPEVIDLYDIDPEEFIAAGFTGFRDPGSFIIFDDDTFLPRNLPLGNIACINERGNKKRVVASPNILINCLAYPLAKVLTDLYERWSCQGGKSHDGSTANLQNRLAESIRNESGITFHSIDMKSFTDNFPYREFQRKILTQCVEMGIISDFDLKVMDLLCSMKFKFLGTNLVISYGTGTPMGSFPSWPLATLANGIMLTMASYKAGITDLDNLPGLVIGDDIVIWNDAVAANYREIARLLAMPISEDKSISSQHVAEMCSKIITPYGVFEQKKLKPTESAGALLEDIQYYGESFINSLNKEYSKIVSYLRMVPKPYGIGRDLKEVRSDLDLSLETGLECKLLINPIEMHFLLKHASNQIERYLGMPFDQTSVHLMFLRMRYYPSIIPGNGDNLRLDQMIYGEHPMLNYMIDPQTNLPFGVSGRNFLRRTLQEDLNRLLKPTTETIISDGQWGRRIRMKNLRKLDGLKVYPNLDEQKIIANIAKVTERLEVSHEDDPRSIKPLSSLENGREAESDDRDSTLKDSYKYYLKEVHDDKVKP